MTQLLETPNSKVVRGRKRASYDRQQVYQLIDDLKLGHIGFVADNQAFVVPITLWRVADHLYFHTMNKGRLAKVLESGQKVCVSFAESSEWVMSKSAYHHSANYRSAVLYCQGERVTEPQQFDDAFKAIIDDLEPGRWEHIRAPSLKERKATALIRMAIDEGSFKSRTGGPNEEPEDMDLPVWHGLMPTKCPVHK